MTSLRQIESNRRNAQKSTGPKTTTERPVPPEVPYVTA